MWLHFDPASDSLARVPAAEAADLDRTYFTQRLRCVVTIYSSRDRVNVIIPGTGYRGEGNHEFPAARGNVVDYVTRCVHAALEQEAAVYAANRRARRDVYGQPFISWDHGRGMHLQPGAYSVDPIRGYRGEYVTRVWVDREVCGGRGGHGDPRCGRDVGHDGVCDWTE